jgi:cation:H+ antiporter
MGSNIDVENEDDNTPDSSQLMALLRLDLETAIIAHGDMRTGNAWVLLSVATLVIAFACFVLVYGCEQFGHAIGIHGYFVAVILAAGASSVPDTILSIRDAKKGNYDDAVSNALGSNIFDICFALGLPLFLYTLMNGAIVLPPELVEHISELRILLLLLTIAVFFIFFFGRGLGKAKATTLLLLYVAFTGYVIARAYEQPWINPVAELLHNIQRVLQ